MRLRSLLVLVLSLWVAIALAGVHPANIPSARAKIQPDGTLDLRVRFDMLAFSLDQSPNDIGDGPMNALLDGPVSELQARLTEAQARFRKNLRLIGDNGSGIIDSISFPTAQDIHTLVDGADGPRLPVMMTVTVSGHFLPGARKTSFRFPDVLGSVVLTTELPYIEPISEPVDPGTSSTPVTLPTVAEVKAKEEAMLAPRTAPNAPKTAPDPEGIKKSSPAVSLLPPGKQPPKPDPEGGRTSSGNFLGLHFPLDIKPEAVKEAPAKSPQPITPPPAKNTPVKEVPPAPTEEAQTDQHVSLLSSFPRYVKMGYTHILPEGLDHILFVLGLFLLSRKAKDLIKQITAFTIAHSLTLALALYGVVRLPSTIVEPIIALSIAFVAVENIFTTEVKAWRPYVVFAFGLVHGLGFAGALQDAGLSRGDMLPALVGFNIGVELGQLSVVALAWLLVARFQKSPRYRPVFAIPASIAIALVAVFWTVQRVL